MKVLVFGASNSKKSINKTLATYASSFLSNTKVEIIDLNNYSAPIYSIDTEQNEGIPSNIKALNQKFEEANGFLVSMAEHNGSYTAAFKSIYDWLSRMEVNVWRNKPLLLLSTSPGSMGGKFVIEAAKAKFPRMGAQITSTLSIPSFIENFKNNQLVNKELNNQLIAAVEKFNNEL